MTRRRGSTAFLLEIQGARRFPIDRRNDIASIHQARDPYDRIGDSARVGAGCRLKGAVSRGRKDGLRQLSHVWEA
jgi:hypothetical protein